LIKGIIFDMGGTLLQFVGDVHRLKTKRTANVAHFFHKKRIKLDAEAFATAIIEAQKQAQESAHQSLEEYQMRDVIVKALQAIEAPKRAEGLVAGAVRAYFEPSEAMHEQIPGAIEVVKALYAQGIKLALLSNAPDDALVQRLINRYGLRPYFSPVFSSAGLGWAKPNPQAFLFIAKRWGLNPQEIVVVGDTPQTDILGAKNAGMHSIFVPRNGGLLETLDTSQTQNITADATIKALSELESILTQLPE